MSVEKLKDSSSEEEIKNESEQPHLDEQQLEGAAITDADVLFDLNVKNPE